MPEEVVHLRFAVLQPHAQQHALELGRADRAVAVLVDLAERGMQRAHVGANAIPHARTCGLAQPEGILLGGFGQQGGGRRRLLRHLGVRPVEDLDGLCVIHAGKAGGNLPDVQLVRLVCRGLPPLDIKLRAPLGPGLPCLPPGAKFELEALSVSLGLVEPRPCLCFRPNFRPIFRLHLRLRHIACCISRLAWLRRGLLPWPKARG